MAAPAPAARRELTAAELAEYRENGFVVARSLFSAAEMDAVRAAIVGDLTLDAHTMAMRDGEGKFARLSLWHHIQPATVYGALAASRRMVHAARVLAGTDVYHIHTKVILKEPRSGGAFDVHQGARPRPRRPRARAATTCATAALMTRARPLPQPPRLWLLVRVRAARPERDALGHCRRRRRGR